MTHILYDIFCTPIFCKHKWDFWHVKLRCDHKKTLDGTILHNTIRKCSKCSKQQQLRMIPGNVHWRESNYKLPTNTNIIYSWVNVYGKKNKSEIRENTIDEILS